MLFSNQIDHRSRPFYISFLVNRAEIYLNKRKNRPTGDSESYVLMSIKPMKKSLEALKSKGIISESDFNDSLKELSRIN